MTVCAVHPEQVLDPIVAAALRQKDAWERGPGCWLAKDHRGRHRFHSLEHDHPFYGVVDSVDRLTRPGEPPVLCYQKWTCEWCGASQQMPDANRLYTHGLCEECRQDTNLEENGCNFFLVKALGGTRADIDRLQQALEADEPRRPDA